MSTKHSAPALCCGEVSSQLRALPHPIVSDIPEAGTFISQALQRKLKRRKDKERLIDVLRLYG